MKNIIIYGIFIIVICITFVAPQTLLKMQNDKMQVEIQVKEQENKIDIETGKIYLVKAIHDIEKDKAGYLMMYDEVNTMTSGASINKIQEKESAKTELYNDIIKLQENEIIENFEPQSGSVMSREMLDRKYTSSENKYTVNCYYLDIAGDYFGYEVESKTEKIIYIQFQKKFRKDASKNEILDNYIKYLELSIIDDWKYENGSMTSDKAGLTASFIEDRDRCYLTINTKEIADKKAYYTDYTDA